VPRAKCLQMDTLPETTEHLHDTEGCGVYRPRHRTKAAGKASLPDRAARACGSWGQVLGTTGRVRSERRLLGSGLLHPLPERVDELKHVVVELAGAVGGGQALDQPQPAVAVLEREELLAVNRRAHVERAKRLLARGRVQDDENARYPLAKFEHRPFGATWHRSGGSACASETSVRGSTGAASISVFNSGGLK
jgi:hypothetical protein